MKLIIIMACLLVLSGCTNSPNEVASAQGTKMRGIAIAKVDGCEYVLYYQAAIVHKRNCKNHKL